MNLAHSKPHTALTVNDQNCEAAAVVLQHYATLTPIQLRLVVFVRGYMAAHNGSPAPSLSCIRYLWGHDAGIERAMELYRVTSRARERLACLGETLRSVPGQGYIWEVTR